MNPTAVLQTHKLSIGYQAGRAQQRCISRDLSLALYPGELVCLLGPNGAGKSTLLRTLMGMQPPLAGEITLRGRELRQMSPREIARSMSIVLTERASPGMMTVYELVALGRQPFTGWLGRLCPADEAIIEEALAAVDALALATRPVDELSDGERQKALIARALAQQPQVMLLDEPTAFLDLPHRVEALATLRQIAQNSGQAILLSMHDLDLAIRSADRIWLMSRDGRIHCGAPEDLVLNGAFQQTFERPGLAFDPSSGSFSLARAHGAAVQLRGEGLHALWTQRALERSGFHLSHNGEAAAIQVELIGANGSTRWRSTAGSASREHDSLYELLNTLRLQQ